MTIFSRMKATQMHYNEDIGERKYAAHVGGIFQTSTLPELLRLCKFDSMVLQSTVYDLVIMCSIKFKHYEGHRPFLTFSLD
jgi:hypothetical protein